MNFLCIIIFIIIIFIMKKKNKTLKEKVLATSFSSDNINENILDKNEKSSKEEDNDHTFI